MPIIRCVLNSYVLVKWKKPITYTIHTLLSKVTRSWNIPGSRKQKKIMKIVKRRLATVSQHRSSAVSSETKLKNPAWSEPTPQLSLGWELTCSVSTPVLCMHCAWANPSRPRGRGGCSHRALWPLCWFGPSPSHVYECQLCKSHHWPHDQCGGYSTGPPISCGKCKCLVGHTTYACNMLTAWKNPQSYMLV